MKLVHDKDFRISEFLNFAGRMLKKEPNNRGEADFKKEYVKAFNEVVSQNVQGVLL